MSELSTLLAVSAVVGGMAAIAEMGLTRAGWHRLVLATPVLVVLVGGAMILFIDSYSGGYSAFGYLAVAAFVLLGPGLGTLVGLISGLILDPKPSKVRS